MSRIATFIKATLLGGLFALLPVFLLFTVLGKVVISARAAAQSLMDKFAGEAAESGEFPLVYAILIVVAACFLLGLVMMSGAGSSFGSWINRNVLSRIPGYSAIRTILGGFGNAETDGSIKMGLLSLSADAKCFVFITEDHGNGWLTVFIPETPNPGTGTVQFVEKGLVEPLNLRLGEIGKAMHQWGIGSAKLLEKHAQRTSDLSEPLAKC